MAATEVQKPDHAAPRRHFIFTEEHEALRESIHSFVIKELAPHAEEWEETTFPDSVFRAHGRARIPRPFDAGGLRRSGRRLLLQPRARRGALVRRLGRDVDGHRGAHRHGDAADPAVRHRGAEAELPRARDPRREDLLPRHHRARRRLGRERDPHARRPRRRRVGHQRLQDLHHQRPPRGLHRARHEDRPGRRAATGFTLFLVDMDAPGVVREKKLEKLGMHASDTALLAFQDVRVPGLGRARARSARASTTSCGSSRGSG